MSVFTSPVLILGSAVMAFMTQLFLQLIIFSEVPMLPDNNNLNILQSHPRCGITTGGREECWWDCSRKLVNRGEYVFTVNKYYSSSYYIKLHVCVSVCVIVSPSVPILRSLHVTNGKLGLTTTVM